jgi:NAD(P)-dependent dehydrogenase (short-subunit alcohol dehydrogenase family)/3-oxoacyl-(acyl-carrier-protein) synthase
MGQLDGKLALVTGGAKNVGKVIARELAVRGAHILLNYFHSHEAAKQMKVELESLGAKVDLFRASVAQQQQVERMFDEIREKYGYLDILVNNAASGALVPVEEVTEESLDKALNTNFKGSLWCARKAAQLMAVRGGGSIINISALGASQFVMANYLACGPAKAAVEALTRYLAAEFAPLGVRVNTASAGMLESSVANSFPHAAEMQQAVIQSTPMGRLGQPEDLARVVAFLASDDAAWITGQIVLADGGLSLGVPLLSPRKPAISTSIAENVPQPAEDDGDQIAIVGMGLVVPGANDPEQYWKILSEGGNYFIDVPNDRWDNSKFLSPDPAAEDKTYQSKSAFVTDFRPCAELQKRDGESVKDCEFTTLWLRHSLLQALENVKRRKKDRCSFVIGYTADGSQHLEEAAVIAGVAARCAGIVDGMDLAENEKQALKAGISASLKQRYARATTSPSRFLPHRVGENAMKDVLPEGTEVLMVDTACSSSLYAIDIGIKGLLMGKQDIAVCGGAFALAPRGSVLFAKLHGISTSGEVRAFDKRSDGVLFADGAAIVVLKKLGRARRDGDEILAVVKGFGASSDGKGKAIYAPSSAGQKIAIERAVSRPGVELKNIEWVIAHATGTPAGDLAEFTTLRQTFDSQQAVYVSSNKSLIGHTGWAAGVVSVIQAILGLKKEAISRQHRFQETPASFEIETTRLTIPTGTIAWPKKANAPRTVSISGFGFGGTNAHLVLEEYRRDTPVPAIAERAYGERIAIVGWSALVPGLASRESVSDWLKGQGAPPAASFGEFYPTPSFDKVRMPPGTVRTIDRCQLMILECAHELKAQIGKFWDEHRRDFGVFVGHMGTTRNAALYGGRCYIDEIGSVLRKDQSGRLAPVIDGLANEIRRLVPPSNEDSFPGSMPNVIPARIANYFDLKGPNMTVDKGFASSLAAVEVASRYLRAKDVDIALVGGINGNTTPEMRHIADDMNLPAGSTLAEGVFLLGLVTESTARLAGLNILGFVDGFSSADAEPSKEPVEACGLPGGALNYLGAEGALAILRALHHPRNKTRIVCREGGTHPDSSIQLFSASETLEVSAPAQVPSRFQSDVEYEPGKPCNVKRQVAKLQPFPPIQQRERIDFLPPKTLLLTDRPDLVDALSGVPADLCVISTVPLVAPTNRRRYLASITPEAVSEWMKELDSPIAHLRLLTSMEVGAGEELTRRAESLTQLHDLTFLVLKHCCDSLNNGHGSFISLFLDSVKAGAVHPFAGLFGGLMKTASFEMQDCVTFAQFSDDTDVAIAASQAVRESAAKRFLPVVVYEGGCRKAMFLEEQAAGLPADAAAKLDRNSVVVAVGGARGITAELLKAVAQHFQPVLYLLGSNPIDSYPAEIFDGTETQFAAKRQQFIRDQRALHPRKNLGLIDKEFSRMADARAARRNILAMEQHCGAGRVRYVACDVLDAAQVQRAFDGIFQREARVDLLINAAGLNRSAPIESKAFEEFRLIRNLKLKGYLHLKQALSHRPPRTWCNFGSLLGFTGQIGEVDYASGNDFLATAAAYSNEVLGNDEYTIGWTLWGEVGLGAKPLTKAYFEKVGLYSNMATAEGIHHFMRELHQAKHPASTVHVGSAEQAAINQLIPGFFRTAEAGSAGTGEAFYLGPVLASGSDEMVFERNFDIGVDAYLRNHVVNGYPTLPGTFVTEIAAEAASRLVPGLEVTAFENIDFHHFLRVYGENRPSPKKISARVTERSAEHTVVRVRISADVKAPNGAVLVRDKPHFELDVVLAKQLPPAPYWEPWDNLGQVAVPDPYHFPSAPVLLTGMFISTVNTRLHPLGKRADYRIELASDHPVFSAFRVPCILLDGLARTGALALTDGEYMPLVAPRTIRRIDLYERTNDCVLAGVPGIQLYATPRDLDLIDGKGSNRCVAARADGRVILQIKDVTGVLLGYVHRTSGDYLTSAEMDNRRGLVSLAAAADR